jgi:hypothetical protein
MRRQGTSENQYFAVKEPFTIEVRVGLADSQVFIGSSMALQDLYETVTVRPGDQLHLLVGGDFLVRGWQAYEFDTRRHEAFEVMLHPAPADPDLPWDHLTRIHESATRIPANGYRAQDPERNQRIRVAP